jgi:hypothetical protein
MHYRECQEIKSQLECSLDGWVDGKRQHAPTLEAVDTELERLLRSCDRVVDNAN